MELLKASITDLTTLQKICRKAYTQNFADHWVGEGLELHLDYQYGTRRLKADLANQELTYFFIKQAGSTIGFIKITYQSNSQLSPLDNCELNKIYLLPAYSGLGIGQQAMATVIKGARAKGKQLLFLQVIDTNVNAIAFYKKLGFKFHSKTRIDAPFFKEELRGMDCMVLELMS